MADVLGHLSKKEDEGNGGNNLGAKVSSNDKSKDGKHVEHGIGGDGGDGSGDAVVINNSGIFMGLKDLAMQMRVCWIGDPMLLNAVPSLPSTSVSFYMLQECPVHS